MKLCISCLLATFACVLAAPAPQPAGPVESVFKMLSGLSQPMISTANSMMGGIPVVNTVPRVLQGGMNIGESFAHNMDYMLGVGGQSNGNQPTDSDESDSGPAVPQRKLGMMERMYKMMFGVPEAIASGASKMVGGIPIIGAIPGMVQNGLNTGENVARIIDNMTGGAGRSMMNKSGDSEEDSDEKEEESEEKAEERIEKEEEREEKKEKKEPTKPIKEPTKPIKEKKETDN